MDPIKLDLKRNSRQIIEKTLEWGEFTQIHWMMQAYPRDEIIEVIKSSRQLSLKSANFWAEYYAIPRSEVRCLTRLLQKKQKVLWPY